MIIKFIYFFSFFYNFHIQILLITDSFFQDSSSSCRDKKRSSRETPLWLRPYELDYSYQACKNVNPVEFEAKEAGELIIML